MAVDALRDAAGPRYAHSLPGRPAADWEPLGHHLRAVGDRAASFAAAFGWAEVMRVAGALHDVGKFSAEFADYIKCSSEGDVAPRGPDHSTAGARVAAASYPGPLGRMLAFIIAGHHAGLADAEGLDRRLAADHAIPGYDGWQAHTPALPGLASLRPTANFIPRSEKGFGEQFLIRILFSCLVDADFLETERFYAKARNEPIERGGGTNLAILKDRLRAHMAQMAAQAAHEHPGRLNELRTEILHHVTARHTLRPGLFTLTVPTGGGKTLASLSFALEHAVRHGLRRIVYVIPYTSIIEQTAEVFRAALGSPDDILEHHANFDWEAATDRRADDDEGADGLRKLQHAAENWDAPIVVTTAVQFFESLFANRTSRCRKLHNLARSVIVLDEAQTMPRRLLRPSMAALDELARNYGASVVLCTATQPALRQIDGFERGFDIGQDRELAPQPGRLYSELERFEVRVEPLPVGDATIAARFAMQNQMLVIVNSRRHARELFDAIKDLPGAVHLSTLMCPRHRRAVLAELRTRLHEGAPVRLVSTSLIEAGVDIDFPEVWRAATGIDSVAQAGGRCNREGREEKGRVIVFEAEGRGLSGEMLRVWQAARAVLRRDELKPLSLDGIREYFAELYWSVGEEALDAAKVGDYVGILPAISERHGDLSFPFESIAQAYRMIEDAMEPVVVPWKADPDDKDAENLLFRIASMPRPARGDLRRLQQYTVTIPRKLRGDWLAKGVLTPVHPGLGPAVLKFPDLAHYSAATGLDIMNPQLRSAESNVWSF
ncbi:MAG: CRISPR-associated helicase Cas3' [Devosia sp.]